MQKPPNFLVEKQEFTPIILNFEVIFAIFRENTLHRQEKLFAPLYSSDNGRPNFPINIFLVALEIIKHLKNFVDEVLIDAFAYDFQISYALGLRNIGELYFARRTFYDFRARLYNYTLEHPKEGDAIFK